jgi:hypothetical protein
MDLILCVKDLSTFSKEDLILLKRYYKLPLNSDLLNLAKRILNTNKYTMPSDFEDESEDESEESEDESEETEETEDESEETEDEDRDWYRYKFSNKTPSYIMTKLDITTFEGADLSNIYFDNCDLKGLNFKGADLKKSKLNKVDFSNANLSNVDLEDAELHNINLQGANLVESTLFDIQAENVNLSFANISNANLEYAKFSESNFSNSIIQNSDLIHTKLIRSDFNSSDLTGSNLSEADLTESKFKNANLTGVDLTDTNLTGVDLTNIIVSQFDINRFPVLNVPNVRIQNLLTQVYPQNQRFTITLNSTVPRTIDQNYIQNCNNPIDTISQQSWVDIVNEDPNTDIIKINTGTNSDGKNIIYCTVRENFVNEINNQPLLTQWVIKRDNYTQNRVRERVARGLPPIDEAGHGTEPMVNGPKFVKINYHYIIVNQELNDVLQSGSDYKLVEATPEPVYIGNVEGEMGESQAHGQVQSKLYKLIAV